MTDKIIAGLYDSSFIPHASASLGGDAAYQVPSLLEWRREQFMPVTFFTDMRLDCVTEAPKENTNIAWLIEPPSLSTTHYETVLKYMDRFAYVLTFHATYLSYSDRFLFYPYGGTWINFTDWKGYTKSKFCSFVISEKVGAPGHRLRLEFLPHAQELGVDAMGRGVKGFASKLTPLAEYHFSVVIESINMDYYFSEKLIDCFATHTVPIYHGCPSIAQFFDPQGMIQFDTIDQLCAVLSVLRPDDYNKRKKAMRNNFEIAKQYRIAEDWIVANCPKIFDKARQHG